MKTALIYNPKIKNYRFGKGHPFTADRFENFINFAKEKLVNFEGVFEQIAPKPAKDEDLRLFHGKEYVDVIKRASQGIIIPDILRYTTVDNLDLSTGYLSKGMHTAGKIVVGSSLKAAELIAENKPRTRTSSVRGKFKKAVVFGGRASSCQKRKGRRFLYI